MTLPSFVVKSAFRNRKRTISTLASIAVSFLLLTVLIGSWYSFYTIRGGGGSAYRLITRNKVSLFMPVMSAYRDKIRTIPGVVHIAQLNWFGGIYERGNVKEAFAQYGTDPSEIFQVFDEWKVSPDEVAAFQHDPSGAAVSKKLAQKYGWKPGDRVFIRGTITPLNLDLHVRAIIDTDDKWDGLLFPWQPIVDAFPRYKGIEGYFVTRVSSPDDVARVGTSIDAMFRNAPMATKSESESAFQLQNLSMLGNVKFFILSVSAATMFAILLVCANSAALSIRERVREIAVFRALGYSRSLMLALIVGESMVLAILGSLIGLGGGLLSLRMASKFPAGQVISHVRLGPPAILAVIAAAIFVAVASSWISAVHGSRGNIATGLRYVG